MSRVILRRKSRLALSLYRIRSRLIIIRDKYFNIKQITRFLFPLVVFIVLIPFALILIMFRSYEKRLKSNILDVPVELRSAVVYLKYEDIINNTDLVKKISKGASDLYVQQKIEKFYIFSFSQSKSIIPVKENILPYFKDIPSDKVIINISIKTEVEICRSAVNEYSLDKFLIISNKEALIRLNYICNSLDLYTVGFLPNLLKDQITEENFLLRAAQTILQTSN